MLQSPLASAFRVAFNFRFTMPGDLFPNIDRVKNVACPVFIIHGTRCVFGVVRRGDRDPSQWYAPWHPWYSGKAYHCALEIFFLYGERTRASPHFYFLHIV